MKKTWLAGAFALIFFPAVFAFSEHPSKIQDQDSDLTEEKEEISFNPRDDYIFGVGTMVGGPLGSVGIIADFNWYSAANAGIGAGSGIYFDTYMAHIKHLFLDRRFTPYVGGGIAYWKSTSSAQEIAKKSETATKLGMVSPNGDHLKKGILLLPVSLGVHYISDLGLALFVEGEYLISLTNLKGTPYAALGLQWYF